MNLIRLLSPINYLAEQDKFFASETYHPRFDYAWDKDEVSEWIVKKPVYSSLAKAVVNQNLDQIVASASSLFKVDILLPLTNTSLSLLEQKPTVLKTAGIKTIVGAFENTLKTLGLDYTVELVDTGGFNIRPMFKSKRILINRHMDTSYFSVAGELRHELTHVIRYENGVYNKIKPSEGVLPTEEGLATYFQDYGGSEENYSIFQHAAEYAVTGVMLKGSLRKGFEFLRELGFNKQLAWTRASRHKFGFRDTQNPGDIFKPAMYFTHERVIKNLSDTERTKLLVGKIKATELDVVTGYKGRWPLEVLTAIIGA